MTKISTCGNPAAHSPHLWHIGGARVHCEGRGKALRCSEDRPHATHRERWSGGTWDCPGVPSPPPGPSRAGHELAREWDQAPPGEAGLLFIDWLPRVLAHLRGTGAPPALPELRWAPYQEFGIPDPARETHEAPAGPVTIGSVGYRSDGDIVIYWTKA